MAEHLDDRLGPIDYLVVEFPGGRITSEGFHRLDNLVDAGHVLVLDLEFVAKDASGAVTVVEITDLDADAGLDLEHYAGASSHLIDGDDVDKAGALIQPGSVAAVLVYEVLTVLPMIAAWERAGATLVAAGAVAFDDLDAALDAAEAKDS